MKSPRPYQIQAIEYMADNNVYLCDECGLGKTLVAIETVKEYGTALGKNLVICPKTARAQWRETILEQIPDAQVILTDHYKYKLNEVNAWFITSFDEMYPKSLLFHMASFVWNTIIIDEAHRLRNRHTARSKNITNLMAGRKIALSATPIENDGGELWPVLKWLNPERFHSYWGFVNRHFEVSKGRWGTEIGGVTDMIDYQATVMPYVIRRTKPQVSPDLPEKIEIPVHLPMNDDQATLYDSIANAEDVLIKTADVELLIMNALTLLTRLHQVSVLPTLIGAPLSSCKLDWLDEWLNDHRDLRVIIFSKYRNVVNYVREMYGCPVVMQGIDESDKFKKDPMSRMLAGTIDSMSESLSLEMADVAIFLDQHWSATKMTQAVDRIHRMNITSPKLIYYLSASPVDNHVIKAYTTKMSERDMLLEFARNQ